MIVRQIDLQSTPSGSWNPLPGDLVWFAPETVKGQWPPDGMRKFLDPLEGKKLDSRWPALIVFVERYNNGEERCTVFHHNRFWWIPRNHWMR